MRSGGFTLFFVMVAFDGHMEFILRQTGNGWFLHYDVNIDKLIR